MGSLKVYATVAGFLALASSVTAVRAADLLPPPPPPPAPVEPVSDIGGGWYLRGDVGVGQYNTGKIHNPGDTSLTYNNKDFGSSVFVGGGVGYQFNSWFRADLTGEYRMSNTWRFNDQGSWYTDNGTQHWNSTSHERTSMGHRAAVFLANGYFDLGNWNGITPFVGGGVGVAHHMLKGGNSDTLNVFGPFYDNASGNVVNGGALQTGVSGGSIANKDQTKFAWALHAGLAYDINPNLKLELAYRYLNMGSITTGAVNCYCYQTYPGFKVKNVDSHDVKLGLRWALGGSAPAPVYEPAPLMRKY